MFYQPFSGAGLGVSSGVSQGVSISTCKIGNGELVILQKLTTSFVCIIIFSTNHNLTRVKLKTQCFYTCVRLRELIYADAF